MVWVLQALGRGSLNLPDLQAQLPGFLVFKLKCSSKQSKTSLAFKLGGGIKYLCQKEKEQALLLKYSCYSSPNDFFVGLLVLCSSSSVVRTSLTGGLDSFYLVKGFVVGIGWKGMNIRIVPLGQSGVVLGAVHLHVHLWGCLAFLSQESGSGFQAPATRQNVPTSREGSAGQWDMAECGQGQTW